MSDTDNKALVQPTLALTHAAALSLLQSAVSKAEALGINATIAVVDTSGVLLAFVKMTGSFLVSAEMARKKAWTAAGMGVDTVELEAQLGTAPARVLDGLTQADGFTVVGGGIPLYADGVLVGGIGVSGGSEAQDIECALAAAKGNNLLKA
ncbi:MAG TPA: heme-binding protein [Marinobacter sp.]|nr:heme-binding protein [Marinobacter sp.]